MPTKPELQAQIADLKTKLAECQSQLADCRAEEPPPTEPPPLPTGGFQMPENFVLDRKDDCTNPDPIPLWKGIAAQRLDGQTEKLTTNIAELAPGRYTHFTTGGVNNGPFRRLAVKDGDNSWGERNELGKNDHRKNADGSDDTLIVYREGTRWVTTIWYRLPSSWPLSSTEAFQDIFQMKQTQPASAGGAPPHIAFKAYKGKWVLDTYVNGVHREAWSKPATIGVWKSFCFDIYYSRTSAGSIKVGDETTPSTLVYTGPTLKTETSPGAGGLSPGDPIPGHLRVGVYHRPELPQTHIDFGGVWLHRPA